MFIVRVVEVFEVVCRFGFSSYIGLGRVGMEVFFVMLYSEFLIELGLGVRFLFFGIV